MTLSIPRYPEFADLPRPEQDVFYVPELEMSWKEICSAMKKCWTGYKIARREADTKTQEYYAAIISGIIEGLGYRPIRFRISADAYRKLHPIWICLYVLPIQLISVYTGIPFTFYTTS
jgi:hypothetical protein